MRMSDLKIFPGVISRASLAFCSASSAARSRGGHSHAAGGALGSMDEEASSPSSALPPSVISMTPHVYVPADLLTATYSPTLNVLSREKKNLCHVEPIQPFPRRRPEISLPRTMSRNARSSAFVTSAFVDANIERGTFPPSLDNPNDPSKALGKSVTCRCNNPASVNIFDVVDPMAFACSTKASTLAHVASIFAVHLCTLVHAASIAFEQFRTARDASVASRHARTSSRMVNRQPKRNATAVANVTPQHATNAPGGTILAVADTYASRPSM
mmetsp:Transcript_40/g.174  ORF Transcript_40/g.174 Transcript_40/m.174 type:complete len:271 (+) Transcript_40:181-993(+)